MINNEKLVAAVTMLKDHGATHVVIEFSGSGDEGSFENVYGAPKELVSEELELEHEAWSSEFDRLTEPMPKLEADVVDLFHDLVNDFADAYDWSNNDGGDGYIMVDLNTFNYKTHYRIHRMETDHYEESGKINFD